MASGNVSVKQQISIPLANPWLWGVLGLTLALLSLVWVTVWHEWGTGGRLTLIFAAMLSSGAAVTIRWNTSRDAFLQSLPKSWRERVLYVVLSKLAVLLLLALYIVITHPGQPASPWSVYQTICLFAIVFPITVVLGVFTLLSSIGMTPVSAKLESSLTMAVLGLTAFVCCWALFAGAKDWDHWFTIRTFLTIAGLVAFAAAGIRLLPAAGQKLVISLIILFHFGGVFTAILSSNSGYLVRHLWSRVYRPYLEFFYLNNSYQFYAPEPGPSAYLWFCIEYKFADEKLPHIFHWEEVPRLNPKTGQPDYAMAVNYQRRVALAELLLQGTTTLPATTMENGQVQLNPKLAWRKAYSTENDRLEMTSRFFTKPVYFKHNVIPMHPQIRPVPTQYREPSEYSKMLLSSMARHILSHKHPENPDAIPYRVKIYHAVHAIQPVEFFAQGFDPHSKITYQPRYMGMYDVNGKLLDEPIIENNYLKSGDPFLYWIIPVLTTDNNPKVGTIVDYVRYHAGYEDYVLYPGEETWQDDKKFKAMQQQEIPQEIPEDNRVIPGKKVIAPKNDRPQKKVLGTEK